MLNMDQRQQKFWDSFDKSAVEARKDLESIMRDQKRKYDSAVKTIDKVRDKCRNQFELQSTNYKKYEEIGESQTFNSSEKVYNKFNVTH